MAGVLLEGVSRVYPGGVVAVNQLDLQVRDREFLVLVGPSGSGKSTTLRLIAGLEEVSAGTIRIGGRAVNGVPPRKRNIAMVFQTGALYPHLTVYKNMAFGLELRYAAPWLKRAWWRVVRPAKARRWAARRRRIAGRVGEAARSLGIEGLLARLPADLSGGERQRVALGRAIVRRPAAFLFDEPLSNLDARLRVEMRRELKQLHQRLAATMIYVTHDQVEALTLGDRIAVLDRGTLQQVGSPLEVYDTPVNRFVAGFIGSPAMNLVEGELVASEPAVGRSGLVFRTRGWSIPVDAGSIGVLQRQAGRRLVLGIRPEDVRLDGGRSDERGASWLDARVVVVEPLGDSTIVHLAAGASGEDRGEPLLLCKTQGRPALAVGDRLRARLDVERARWFDGLTGQKVSFGFLSSHEEKQPGSTDVPR